MMKKSSEAFRTISEVSDLLDIPAHVLRFWESKFSQIKPVKRGGGRRYYRPDDINLLRGIRGLLYTNGLTIKGTQKLFRDKGVRHVVELGSEDQDGVEVVAKALQKHQAGSARAATPAEQPGLFEPTAEAAPLKLDTPAAQAPPEPPAAATPSQQELRRIIARLQALRDAMRG